MLVPFSSSPFPVAYRIRCICNTKKVGGEALWEWVAGVDIFFTVHMKQKAVVPVVRFMM